VSAEEIAAEVAASPENADPDMPDVPDTPDVDIPEENTPAKKEPEEDVEMPKFDNNDDIDYSKCIQTNTPDLRQAYCSEQYSDEEMIKRCSNKFCNFCCTSKFPENMLAKTIICENECNAETKPSDIGAFTNCYNPFDPQHAVAAACTQLYEEKPVLWQQNLC